MARTIRRKGPKIKGTVRANGTEVGVTRKLTKKQWMRFMDPKKYTVTFKEDPTEALGTRVISFKK